MWSPYQIILCAQGGLDLELTNQGLPSIIFDLEVIV
jgi:hypothetical protein